VAEEPVQQVNGGEEPLPTTQHKTSGNVVAVDKQYAAVNKRQSLPSERFNVRYRQETAVTTATAQRRRTPRTQPRTTSPGNNVNERPRRPPACQRLRKEGIRRAAQAQPRQQAAPRVRFAFVFLSAPLLVARCRHGWFASATPGATRVAALSLLRWPHAAAACPPPPPVRGSAGLLPQFAAEFFIICAVIAGRHSSPVSLHCHHRRHFFPPPSPSRLRRRLNIADLLYAPLFLHIASAVFI